MMGVVMLLSLVLVPLVVALIGTRLARSRSFVVWSAIVAELVTIALTRMWSEHAAARALERATREHRNLLILHGRQTLEHQLVVGCVLALLAAGIATVVFTLSRPAHA